MNSEHDKKKLKKIIRTLNIDSVQKYSKFILSINRT